MKKFLALVAFGFLVTSAEASDIKVYEKTAEAKGLKAHGIELSRALHKRGKSKKWGRVNGPDVKTEEANKIMSGHRKKKSPKEEKVKF